MIGYLSHCAFATTQRLRVAYVLRNTTHYTHIWCLPKEEFIISAPLASPKEHNSIYCPVVFSYIPEMGLPSSFLLFLLFVYQVIVSVRNHGCLFSCSFLPESLSTRHSSAHVKKVLCSPKSAPSNERPIKV